VLFDEPGAENLTDEILGNSVVSTVNQAEVQTRLMRMGRSAEDAWEDARSLGIPAEVYTSEQAKTAGSLVAKTAKLGLSLGDRSCLALAIELKVPVYTTDQIWKNLQVGVPIHVIR
jgi:PIN domain nuclease of toxin-antitoxin system